MTLITPPSREQRLREKKLMILVSRVLEIGVKVTLP